MNLQAYVAELSRNPHSIKKIEAEVDRLVQADDMNEITNCDVTSNASVFFYVCKILEQRAKRKILALNLADEIAYATKMLHLNPTFQLLDVYSLLGLYCWPFKMPDFFNEISNLSNSKIGYEILLLFFEKVNTSTDIDEKRRNELKKAISLLSKEMLSSFKEEYAEYIIPIYTQLLTIIPKDFDFSLVFKKASEYPESAVEFFTDAICYFDVNRLVEVLEFLPEDPNLVQILSAAKRKSINSPEKVFQYVFKSLSSDPECLIPSIEFWQKIFSCPEYNVMVEPVMTEVIRATLSADEEVREETDSQVFGFFNIVAKNYPIESVEFVKKHGDQLPQRIAANLLQKISRVQVNILLNTSFQSTYLNCLVNFLRNDPNTPNLIFSLNFADKESVRLGLQILEKYTFNQQALAAIISQCEKGCLSANEIKVECLVKLGMDFSFNGEWDMNKVIMFYYFLKKAPAAYSVYRDSYYSLFVQRAPFDRCFAIVEKLGDVPPFILENIYNNLDKYPFIDICCFNNDLLPSLPIKKPFIERQVAKYISEWNTVVNYKDYYQAIKSLLPMLTSPDTFDYLIDLIQIECSMITNKILGLFNSYKEKFNTRKAVYYLIMAYNSPNMRDSQALLSASLTECLYQDDGAVAFVEIIGLDMQKCCDTKAQLSKCNRKTAQNLVRNLLKDFKGKIFGKLFENEYKVTKQDFLSKPKTDDNDSAPLAPNF